MCASCEPCCTIVDERNAVHRVTGHRRTIAQSDTRKLALPGPILGRLPGMVSLKDETMSPAAQPTAMHEEPNTRLNPFRTAPNLLTLLRICLAPFLVAAILEGHYVLSFVLFVAAGLTDALDGALARCAEAALHARPIS